MIGDYLQCWVSIDQGSALRLVDNDDIPLSSVVRSLLRATEWTCWKAKRGCSNAAVDAVLDGEGVGRLGDDSLLRRLSIAIQQPTRIPVAFGHVEAERTSLLDYRSHLWDVGSDLALPHFEIAESGAQFVEAFTESGMLSLEKWNTTVEPWERIVHEGERSSAPGRSSWSSQILRRASAREKSSARIAPIFSTQTSLWCGECGTPPEAGSRKWWYDQMRLARGTPDLHLVLLVSPLGRVLDRGRIVGGVRLLVSGMHTLNG